MQPRASRLPWLAVLVGVAIARMASAQDCWECTHDKSGCLPFATNGMSGCDVVNSKCVPAGNQCGVAEGGGDDGGGDPGGILQHATFGGPEDPYLVYGAVFLASTLSERGRLPGSTVYRVPLTAGGAASLAGMLGRPADASAAGLGLALSFMSVGVGSYTRHYPIPGGLEIEWRIESSSEARTLILNAVEAGASQELTRFMLDQGRREMLVPFERNGQAYAIAVGVRFDKAGQSVPYDQDLAGIASGNAKYQGSNLEIGSPTDAIRPAHTSTWGSLKAIYR